MSTAEQVSLDAVVADAVTKALSSESIGNRVQMAAEKAVGEAIENAFGYRGPFRESVKQAIEKVLPLVSSDDLTTFAHAVDSVVKQRLTTLANETAEKYVGELMDNMLPKDPVITLADLREAYVESVREKGRDDCDCHDYDDEPDITWEIEESDTLGVYFHLWFADTADVSRYSSESSWMAFRTDEETGLAECYAVTISGKQMQ